VLAALGGAAPATPNYQGLWWNAPAGSEPGWGLHLNHQGDIIFATWYTYDVNGAPLWMVVAATRTAAGSYSGTLYRATGPAFGAAVFDPAQVVGLPVGTATLTFPVTGSATFATTIGGVARSRNITREVFSSPVSVCTWGEGSDPALATNYQGLWWNAPAGSESGWGIDLDQQGDIIFATWFTFGADGKPLWLVVAAGQAAPGVYTGTLYTGTGPPYDAATFDPGAVQSTAAGAAVLKFADGNHASFTYSVNGVSQTKAITREIFAPPGTLCR